VIVVKDGRKDGRKEGRKKGKEIGGEGRWKGGREVVKK